MFLCSLENLQEAIMYDLDWYSRTMTSWVMKNEQKSDLWNSPHQAKATIARMLAAETPFNTKQWQIILSKRSNSLQALFLIGTFLYQHQSLDVCKCTETDLVLSPMLENILILCLIIKFPALGKKNHFWSLIFSIATHQKPLGLLIIYEHCFKWPEIKSWPFKNGKNGFVQSFEFSSTCQYDLSVSIKNWCSLHHFFFFPARIFKSYVSWLPEVYR